MRTLDHVEPPLDPPHGPNCLDCYTADHGFSAAEAYETAHGPLGICPDHRDERRADAMMEGMDNDDWGDE